MGLLPTPWSALRINSKRGGLVRRASQGFLWLLLLPVLGVAGNAQANYDVDGTLTRTNVSLAGCDMQSVTAAYRFYTLLGEPVKNGTYQWTAGAGTAADCLPYDTQIAFKVTTSQGGEAWIHESPVVPDAGSGYGYQTPGSPSWDTYLCGTGANRNTCLSAEQAKDMVRAGLQVVDFYLYTRSGQADSGAGGESGPGGGDSGGDTGGGDETGGGADSGASCPAAPQFEFSRYPFKVDPYIAPGTYIGQVSANDLNGCSLTYRRGFGQYADTFNVSSNGVITLAKDWPVSVDTLREYSFRVEAFNGTFIGSTTVEIRFPTLDVSPVTPRLIDLDDSTGPTEWSYQITNVSTGPLDAFVAMEDSPEWLELVGGETIYSLAAGESVSVTVALTASADTLAPRNQFYEASLRVADYTNSDVKTWFPRLRAVKRPDLLIEPEETLQLTYKLGASSNLRTTEAEFSVTNGASDTLYLNVTPPEWAEVFEPGWSNVVTQLVIEPGETVTRLLRPSHTVGDKAPGIYSGSLLLTTQFGATQTLTRAVELEVSNAESGTLNFADGVPEALTFSVDSRVEPIQRLIGLVNQGEQTINYRLEIDEPQWLLACRPDSADSGGGGGYESTLSTEWSNESSTGQFSTIGMPECPDNRTDVVGGAVIGQGLSNILIVADFTYFDTPALYDSDIRLYADSGQGETLRQTVTVRAALLGPEQRLALSPESGWSAISQDFGATGFFDQGVREFVVQNLSREPLGYEFGFSPDSDAALRNGVSISHFGGVIEAGASQRISVDLDVAGSALQAGIYTGTLELRRSGQSVPDSVVALTAEVRDRDGDGVPDPLDAFPDDPTETLDTDGDGVGNNVDPDDDGDGVPDVDDLFPLDPTDWADTDGDGIGDNSDFDIDNDGFPNHLDDDPYVPADTDGDGVTNDLDPDIDGDGVPNAEDAFPFDPEEWLDTDGDGVGNNADPDDDGDGIPDEFELAADGLDPLDPSDAAADFDGDGRTNLEEYQEGGNLFADDVPPVISVAQPEVIVPSEGYTTAVDLGEVSAVDGKDGEVTPRVSPQGPYRPGLHELTWTAVDAAGNRTEVEQRLKVVPQISFDVQQQDVAEGARVTIGISLNGLAADYPVRVDYRLAGGTASGRLDHNAASGQLLIEDGEHAGFSFETVADSLPESNETVLFTLTSPQNAVLGEYLEHTVTLREDNLPPTLELSVYQSDEPRSDIVASASELVELRAQVEDPNPDDSHDFDWSGTDNALVELADGDPSTFRFSTEYLDPGLYRVGITVTDSGEPELSVTQNTLIRVLATAPSLSSDEDSDGDGIADSVEGLADMNGDRIPDYLAPASRSVQELPLNEDGLLMRVFGSAKLRLGDIAFASGRVHAGITTEDIALFGGPDGGTAPGDSDSDYQYPVGLWDFEIVGISPGSATYVYVTLPTPIPAGATYRKYLPGYGWLDFEVTDNDSISSSLAVDGSCTQRYEPGLTAGHECLLLLLQDGGPNDADGEANGVIKDPGGLAVLRQVGEPSSPEPDNSGSDGSDSSGDVAQDGGVSGGGSGGGSSSLLLWLTLLFLAVRAKSLLKERKLAAVGL